MKTQLNTHQGIAQLSWSSGRKLPVILQNEAAECGLACVAMIAGYFGDCRGLAQLRRDYPTSAYGTTLKQLINVASSVHLAGRALKLDTHSLKQLQLPCILHWEMKHFVALKKVSAQHIIIHDPACGERTVSMAETNDKFTGVALELSPTAQFKPRASSPPLRLTHFWQRIVGLKRSLLLVLLLSFILQVFAIASPYYMQTVIDEVLLRSDLSLLKVLAIGFALLLALEVVTTAMRQHLLLAISSKLTIQMAANVFHHLIRLPLAYFNRRHMGDIVSRFGSLNDVRELLTQGLVAVVVDGLMALITLIVMAIYSLKLAAIVLGVVLVYAAIRGLSFQPFKLMNEERIVASAKESSHFMESVRAVQMIKLFEKESERHGQWQNLLVNVLNHDIRIGRWNIGFNGINLALFGLENILVVYFAATLVMENALSVGMLFAFMSYKSRFIGAMDGLIDKWLEFKMLGLHFERLADIVFTKQEPYHQQVSAMAVGHSDQPISAGAISFTNLTYAYSKSDSPALKGISGHIEAGTNVAICGASGSGKTTLLKCLMGLLPVDEGQILVDGKPMHAIRGYRNRIAAVMQNDQLLSGSIADNITGFESQTDMERVIFAANLACIHDDITNMAMQYNTLLGDMGDNLSGGQRQRLVLARALYKRPKILFMDEATSHLDNRNEKLINQHIRNLSITRITVAHRQETLRTADRIFRLDAEGLTDVTDTAKLTH